MCTLSTKGRWDKIQLSGVTGLLQRRARPVPAGREHDAARRETSLGSQEERDAEARHLGLGLLGHLAQQVPHRFDAADRLFAEFHAAALADPPCQVQQFERDTNPQARAGRASCRAVSGVEKKQIGRAHCHVFWAAGSSSMCRRPGPISSPARHRRDCSVPELLDCSLEGLQSSRRILAKQRAGKGALRGQNRRFADKRGSEFSQSLFQSLVAELPPSVVPDPLCSRMPDGDDHGRVFLELKTRPEDRTGF